MLARRFARVLALLSLTAGIVGAFGAGAAGGPDTARASGRTVLVVGDSLAVGVEPFLASMLPYRTVEWNAVSGRTTPQGIVALRTTLRRVTPQTLVISLGTNDGPSPARFRNRIDRVLAAAPAGACVVWATVIRAKRKGPYAALNATLRAEARVRRNLVLVDWERAVASGRVALPDGVHPDAAGFRYRSRLIAAAVHRGC
jgi:lysophospholipase L1-like esterase